MTESWGTPAAGPSEGNDIHVNEDFLDWVWKTEPIFVIGGDDDVRPTGFRFKVLPSYHGIENGFVLYWSDWANTMVWAEHYSRIDTVFARMAVLERGSRTSSASRQPDGASFAAEMDRLWMRLLYKVEGE